MGKVDRRWQDVDGLLTYFWKTTKLARMKYEEYVSEGGKAGRRPELVGGGLIRSKGGWSEVLSLRSKGERECSDERILGSGEFVERVMREAEAKIIKTLRWKKRGVDLKMLLKEVAGKVGV